MSPFATFVARRLARACVLVIVVASAAVLLVHLAPGDAVTELGLDPARAAAERSRLGLDRSFVSQYTEWVGRLLTLDLGESVRFQRPVVELLVERVGYTLVLGVAALVLALGIGLPAGVLTGQRRGDLVSRGIAAISLLLLSTPPLVTALLFLLIASRTGWFPPGGLGVADGTGPLAALEMTVRYLPLPALALALPIAASLERLQSQAVAEALRDPCVIAAQARGLSASRVIWVHAWRLSLKPVLGVLGIVIGSVLSGSFVVELVMSWPGLGNLMFEALTAQDLHLAAGCAAMGAGLLSIGLLSTDIALASADPVTIESA
ncbi:MAG: ABC transporter permease [Acidobacteriota bacterium]|nr:ABC transporter permease [Acidobacteriota bacterium]